MKSEAKTLTSKMGAGNPFMKLLKTFPHKSHRYMIIQEVWWLQTEGRKQTITLEKDAHQPTVTILSHTSGLVALVDSLLPAVVDIPRQSRLWSSKVLICSLSSCNNALSNCPSSMRFSKLRSMILNVHPHKSDQMLLKRKKLFVDDKLCASDASSNFFEAICTSIWSNRVLFGGEAVSRAYLCISRADVLLNSPRCWGAGSNRSDT